MNSLWTTHWWVAATPAAAGFDFSSVSNNTITETLEVREKDGSVAVRHINWVADKATRPKTMPINEAGLQLLRLFGSPDRLVVVPNPGDRERCADLRARLLQTQGAGKMPAVADASSLSEYVVRSHDYDLSTCHGNGAYEPRAFGQLDREAIALKGPTAELAIDVNRSLRCLRLMAADPKDGSPSALPRTTGDHRTAVSACRSCRLGGLSQSRGQSRGSRMARVLVAVAHATKPSMSMSTIVKRMRQSAERIGLLPDLDVAATFAVKCMPFLTEDPPAGRRKPLSAEVQACSRHLKNEILVVRPGAVIFVGSISAQESVSFFEDTPLGVWATPGFSFRVPVVRIGRKATANDDDIDRVMRTAAGWVTP